MESTLGHCTYAALIRRETMTVFSAAHAFVHATCTKDVELWRTVKDEFAAFVGLLVFMESDWWLPWNRD
eukprot:5450963-Pyramimonas_sp.AAC.1